MATASPTRTSTFSWWYGTAIAGLVGLGVATLSSIVGGRFGFAPDILFLVVLGASALAVGAVILRRRPEHGVGRVCLIGGLCLIVSYVARELIYTTAVDFSMPVRALLASAMSVGSLGALVLLGPVLAAIFPSGRFGRIGRRVAIAYLSVVVPLAILTAVTSPVVELDGVSIRNPLYIPSIQRRLPVPVDVFMIAAYVSSLVLAAIGLILRYRRADAVGRLQIRWVAANLVALLVTMTLVFVFPETIGEQLWWLWITLAGFTPVAVAIAITRYRLYDLDRLVSSTVTYGVVTVLLFATFLVANLALTRAMVSLTGLGSPLTVAASTLLVAALFNPIRGRVQSAVDRRFHRARYDADRLVAGFAGRLRDEVDLGALRREIVATVDGSVEPSGVGLWLRERPVAR